VTKRNIGQEIIAGLEEIKAWKHGKIKLRTSTLDLPTAADVPGIRKSLGLSQTEFARFMGVSLATLRNWEQRRREPHGPARSLLLVAAKQPRAVIAAFKSGITRPTRKAHKKARAGIASAARAA
jgi:putative transcriptional regulator